MFLFQVLGDTHSSHLFLLLFVSAWCVERDIEFELERIKFDELNELLSEFYVKVHQEKGEEYSKSGLLGPRYRIERYFNEHVPSFQNIVMSKHLSFVKSNKVLNAILKTVKRQNKLMIVHKAVIQELTFQSWKVLEH